MDQTLVRGDLTELRCILDFQKRGYYCSIPFSGSCRYDVIADVNGKLLRIQCKSASLATDSEGSIKIATVRSTTNTHETKKYTYSKDEIDFFYTYWENYGFLVPVEECSTSKYLRMKKPQNGIQETMSIAADYLIDNVIEAICENKTIKKYRDNRIISIVENGQEHLWTTQELQAKYEDRQIRYIKEKIMKNGKAYELNWKYKEFPAL